jgi:acetyl esterase/lipase
MPREIQDFLTTTKSDTDKEDAMYSPSYGILGTRAPAWNIQKWFNVPAGKQAAELADYADNVVYLYCFQSWCPGCHSSGFPSMLAAMDMFRDARDVSFVTVQTVFEGFEANSAAKAQETADRYKLTIPVGHDPGPDNSGSVLMRHYQALDAAGQTVKLDLYEGMIHVFMVAIPNSPESQLALSKVDAFLKEHLRY